MTDGKYSAISCVLDNIMENRQEVDLFGESEEMNRDQRSATKSNTLTCHVFTLLFISVHHISAHICPIMHFIDSMTWGTSHVDQCAVHWALKGDRTVHRYNQASTCCFWMVKRPLTSGYRNPPTSFKTPYFTPRSHWVWLLSCLCRESVRLVSAEMPWSFFFYH